MVLCVWGRWWLGRVWCIWGWLRVCDEGLVLIVRWAALGGVPGGHVPPALVPVIWAPQADAAPIIVSWLRAVRMRGGGRLAPPLCELKYTFLVSRVLSWLRRCVCPGGLWGVCVFILLHPARRSFVVWLGEVPYVEEFLR
jgi:hypothetical protein